MRSRAVTEILARPGFRAGTCGGRRLADGGRGLVPHKEMVQQAPDDDDRHEHRHQAPALHQHQRCRMTATVLRPTIGTENGERHDGGDDQVLDHGGRIERAAVEGGFVDLGALP